MEARLLAISVCIRNNSVVGAEMLDIDTKEKMMATAESLVRAMKTGTHIINATYSGQNKLIFRYIPMTELTVYDEKNRLRQHGKEIIVEYKPGKFRAINDSKIVEVSESYVESCIKRAHIFDKYFFGYTEKKDDKQPSYDSTSSTLPSTKKVIPAKNSYNYKNLCAIDVGKQFESYTSNPDQKYALGKEYIDALVNDSEFTTIKQFVNAIAKTDFSKYIEDHCDISRLVTGKETYMGYVGSDQSVGTCNLKIGIEVTYHRGKFTFKTPIIEDKPDSETVITYPNNGIGYHNNREVYKTNSIFGTFIGNFPIIFTTDDDYKSAISFTALSGNYNVRDVCMGIEDILYIAHPEKWFGSADIIKWLKEYDVKDEKVDITKYVHISDGIFRTEFVGLSYNRDFVVVSSYRDPYVDNAFDFTKNTTYSVDIICPNYADYHSLNRELFRGKDIGLIDEAFNYAGRDIGLDIITTMDYILMDGNYDNDLRQYEHLHEAFQVEPIKQVRDVQQRSKDKFYNDIKVFTYEPIHVYSIDYLENLEDIQILPLHRAPVGIIYAVISMQDPNNAINYGKKSGTLTFVSPCFEFFRQGNNVNDIYENYIYYLKSHPNGCVVGGAIKSVATQCTHILIGTKLGRSKYSKVSYTGEPMLDFNFRDFDRYGIKRGDSLQTEKESTIRKAVASVLAEADPNLTVVDGIKFRRGTMDNLLFDNIVDYFIDPPKDQITVYFNSFYVVCSYSMMLKEILNAYNDFKKLQGSGTQAQANLQDMMGGTITTDRTMELKRDNNVNVVVPDGITEIAYFGDYSRSVSSTDAITNILTIQNNVKISPNSHRIFVKDLVVTGKATSFLYRYHSSTRRNKLVFLRCTIKEMKLTGKQAFNMLTVIALAPSINDDYIEAGKKEGYTPAQRVLFGLYENTWGPTLYTTKEKIDEFKKMTDSLYKASFSRESILNLVSYCTELASDMDKRINDIGIDSIAPFKVLLTLFCYILRKSNADENAVKMLSNLAGNLKGDVVVDGEIPRMTAEMAKIYKRSKDK